MTRSSGDDPASTLSDISTERELVVGTWLRRVTLVLLTVFVGGALFGLFGVHSRSVTATDNGRTLTVEYAGIARAGLDVPLRITVSSTAPLPDQVTLAIPREYLAIFETQGFHPEPAESVSRGSDVLLTFDIAEGEDTLVVDYDAYLQPSAQQGAEAVIAVVDEDFDPLVAVSFHTFLFP